MDCVADDIEITRCGTASIAQDGCYQETVSELARALVAVFTIV